jgi:hypothetical protein
MDVNRNQEDRTMTKHVNDDELIEVAGGADNVSLNPTTPSDPTVFPAPRPTPGGQTKPETQGDTDGGYGGVAKK